MLVHMHNCERYIMTDNQFEIVNPEAEYSALLEQVGETLEKGRGRLVSAVNAVMVQTY